MAGTVRTSGTVGTGWRRRCGEDSRLIRHDPMDWTVGTFGTVENDALDAGDCLADAGDCLADAGDAGDSVDSVTKMQCLTP